MAMLQVLAAHLAGIAQLVFHTFDRAGGEGLTKALAAFENAVAGRASIRLKDVLDRVIGMSFQWGTSDGN